MALVGYTNAGKSSLLAALVNEEVESLDADDEDKKFSVDDKVFATLDPLTRRVQVADQTALVTDTVGFVSKLPAQVVAAFRATLEEVSNAAVIVHVVDASAPRHIIRARCQVVDQELDALGCRGTPKLVFYNKLDAMADATSLREKAAVSKHVAVGSAASGDLGDLREQLAGILADALLDVRVTLPYDDASYGGVRDEIQIVSRFPGSRRRGHRLGRGQPWDLRLRRTPRRRAPAIGRRPVPLATIRDPRVGGAPSHRGEFLMLPRIVIRTVPHCCPGLEGARYMSCAIRAQVVHTLRRAKTLRSAQHRGQRQFWSDMPAGASSILWFEELFGFREGSYRENRAHFRMEGESVRRRRAEVKAFRGRWSTPPLAGCAPSSAMANWGLRWARPPYGRRAVDPRHAERDAVFQAAPQFNAWRWSAWREPAPGSPATATIRRKGLCPGLPRRHGLPNYLVNNGAGKADRFTGGCG